MISFKVKIHSQPSEECKRKVRSYLLKAVLVGGITWVLFCAVIALVIVATKTI